MVTQYAVGPVVDAPPITPPATGLLVAAPVLDETDSRQLGGSVFQSTGCIDGNVYKNDCGNEPTFSTDPTPLAPRTFFPFLVDKQAICTAVQSQELNAQARRALAAFEPYAVEAEFWTGAIDDRNRHLADDDTDNTTVLASGAAQGLTDGLGKLIQGIADNRLGRGMIHARPFLVNAWVGRNLLRWENGKLYTLTGALVVPGHGYPGTAPDGTDPTASSEWAYATEMVEIHRWPVEVPDDDPRTTLDRVTNTRVVRAQRYYSVRFNACAVIGVNVDPTTP